MLRWIWIVAILGPIWIASPGPAGAGIYNPGEWHEGATYPDFIGSPTGKNFRDVLILLRTIPVKLPEIDNPVRRRYVFEDELISRAPPSAFKTAEERLAASAVLLRRRKFKEAELMLRPLALAAAERDNIPIQSNFATALHMQGELQKAHDTLRPVVKDYWQKNWSDLPEPRQKLFQNIGWDDSLYNLYRGYDAYYLKLLRLRLREQLTKKARTDLVQPPDALFDDGKDPPTPVRFVNEAGEFEAGRIADAERVKLLPGALPIVQQLLVWMPEDLRLYWLLGELYNAQPNAADKENRSGILAALQIFKELSDVAPDGVKDQLKARIGVLSTAKERFDREDAGKIDKELNQIEKRVDAGFPIDWRTVAISFGVGFLLALFAVWQFREIQRRRQARMGSKAHPI
jgi:hypothetical protein